MSPLSQSLFKTFKLHAIKYLLRGQQQFNSICIWMELHRVNIFASLENSGKTHFFFSLDTLTVYKEIG